MQLSELIKVISLSNAKKVVVDGVEFIVENSSKTSSNVDNVVKKESSNIQFVDYINIHEKHIINLIKKGFTLRKIVEQLKQRKDKKPSSLFKKGSSIDSQIASLSYAIKRNARINDAWKNREQPKLKI